jgi:4-amino-4-deoxy-L-arabinose transferase-like glycosyltransferase
MPISEGWYTEYAWLINHGELPYRDFEYLFFPLYTYIIAAFTSVFGYSIVALRILGIFVFAGIGAAIYCSLAKLFDNLSGMIGAVTAAIFLQSEIGQLFYDYIRFHDLFAAWTAFCLISVAINCYDSKSLVKQHPGKVVVLLCKWVLPGIGIVTGTLGIAKGMVTGSLLQTAAFGIVLVTSGITVIWRILKKI